MPILQSRMIALIDAGKDYQQALRKLIRQIEFADIEAQKLGTEPSLSLLNEELKGIVQGIVVSAQELFLLKHPLDSGRVLDLEEAHFCASKTRNEASKRWIQRKRADGLYTQTSAKPKTKRKQRGEAATTNSYSHIDEEIRQHERDEERKEAGEENSNLVEAEEGQEET